MDFQISGSSQQDVSTLTQTQEKNKQASSGTSPQASDNSNSQDTVKLSTNAQVHLLKSQGESTNLIASNLGLTSSEVEDYLGLVSLTQVDASALTVSSK